MTAPGPVCSLLGGARPTTKLVAVHLAAEAPEAESVRDLKGALGISQGSAYRAMEELLERGLAAEETRYPEGYSNPRRSVKCVAAAGALAEHDPSAGAAGGRA